MKKTIITAGIVLFVIVVKAQPPQGPPSIEERIKHTNEVLQKEVQPTAAQKAAIEAAYTSFFTAADKLRKDNPPPPPPPPDPKVKAAMDKLVKERDESIKRILSEAQYEKYQEAAKKLHPPKPGEPGGKDGPPPHQR
jgi:hypothetical protein